MFVPYWAVCCSPWEGGGSSRNKTTAGTLPFIPEHHDHNQPNRPPSDFEGNGLIFGNLNSVAGTCFCWPKWHTSTQEGETLERAGMEAGIMQLMDWHFSEEGPSCPWFARNMWCCTMSQGLGNGRHISWVGRPPEPCCLSLHPHPTPDRP